MNLEVMKGSERIEGMRPLRTGSRRARIADRREEGRRAKEFG